MHIIAERWSSPIGRLLGEFWRRLTSVRRIQLYLLLLLMLVAALAEVVSIGSVLPFIAALTAPDRVYAHPLAQPIVDALGLVEAQQLLLPLTVFFCSAALLAGAVRLLLLWAQTRLGHAIGSDLSVEIYRRTLFQPYITHVARNSSEVIAGVTVKADSIVNGITIPILTILSSCLTVVAILGTLVVFQPLIAGLAFAAFGGIYALVILVARGRLADASRCISRESTQVIKALQEGLGGIRDVLIDGAQAQYCNQYRDADRLVRRSRAVVQIITYSPRLVIEAVGLVLIAALAYSLASHSHGVAETVPLLGAVAIAAQRMLPMAQQVYSSLAHIRAGKDFLADVLDLLDQPLLSTADAPTRTPLLFNNSITLNKVSFRYGPKEPWVLREANLAIPKGSRVGFIGSTGSGKSTLLDIVMGLLHPTDGVLAVDGTAITPDNYRSWQAHIAHVSQSIFLADTTIAENIAFGVSRNEINFPRVREAALRAQIGETIEAMDRQYDTRVGERGIRLSGGQRQRIGIARALYKGAKVIVFDEATSALDTETETAVMEEIYSLGKDLTILMVSHRLTTLKNCTKIIEVANGELRSVGTYQQIVG